MIRTEAVDGFVIDTGPDTLLAHKPAAIAMCHDLRLGDALVSPLGPRTTYVVRQGRLRALPETSAMGLPTDWRTLITTRAFSWLEPLGRLCDGIRHAPSVTVTMAYRASAVRHPLRGWGFVVPATEGRRVDGDRGAPVGAARALCQRGRVPGCRHPPLRRGRHCHGASCRGLRRGPPALTGARLAVDRGGG